MGKELSANSEMSIYICNQYDLEHANSDDLAVDAQQCPTDAAGNGNVCGVHVHAYQDDSNFSGCSDVSNIGGHFYNTADPNAVDEWAPAHLNQGQDVSQGNTEPGRNGQPISGTFVGIRNFYTGLDKRQFQDLYNGRIFVTHNNVGNGSRTGCCVLETMPSKRDAKKFKYYVPEIVKTGQAEADESLITIAKPTKIYLSLSKGSTSAVDVWVKLGEEYENATTGETYNDSGSCANDASGVGNVCGIHIHSGTSCDDAAGQGGHYFGGSAQDPWGAVRMQSFGSYGYKGNIETGIDLTTNQGSIEGRVFVVHNGNGARVWCGVIAANPKASRQLLI